MKLVIKIGGAALDDGPTVRLFACTMGGLIREGYRVIVVHGGGSALTRTLQALGHTSRFVGGLRVTDATTREVALMVLAGRVNKGLVAALDGAGAPAIGLCGGDLRIVLARRKQAEEDLGFVGDVIRVEDHWLDLFWTHGVTPVIASIALGEDGEYYNVNADEVASSCAAATGADGLIFLTDVSGVRGADGAPIRILAAQRIPAMIRETTVQGGMLPKLEACTQALARGVPRVHLVPFARMGELSGLFHRGIECGTEVVLP